MANDTTINTISVFKSNGLLSIISQTNVITTPTIIEEIPPMALTRFQKNTAKIIYGVYIPIKLFMVDHIQDKR